MVNRTAARVACRFFQSSTSFFHFAFLSLGQRDLWPSQQVEDGQFLLGQFLADNSLWFAL